MARARSPFATAPDLPAAPSPFKFSFDKDAGRAFIEDGTTRWPLLERRKDGDAVLGLRPWLVDRFNHIYRAQLDLASLKVEQDGPLRWSLLEALRRKGVALATLTHGAGLSNTGDPAIDAALPLPERYAVPQATVDAVAAARAAGGRVVAVGTTVVRALEGAAADGGGELRAGAGVTALKLGPGTRRHVVATADTWTMKSGTRRRIDH